jgi:hypothetical protein
MPTEIDQLRKDRLSHSCLGFPYMSLQSSSDLCSSTETRANSLRSPEDSFLLGYWKTVWDIPPIHDNSDRLFRVF